MRVDVHAGPRVAPSARAGTDVEEAPVELDGVVVLDGALVLEGAHAIEIRARGGGPPRRRGVRRGSGEARIVAWEKSVEDALGLRQRPRVGEAELEDKAILERAEEPLDPTLRLGRSGRNPTNAELLERPPDLGGLGRPLQLLGQGQRGAGIAVKDPMAIGVGGGGEAIAPDQVAEQEEVALGIFLITKHAPEHLAGCIVNRRVEDEAGAAIFEPGMVAAIHLDEKARLRHAVAAAAMPWGTAGTGTADPGLTEEPANRRAGQAQSFALPQQLGEMVIIRAGIAGTGQGEHPGPEALGQAPGRWAAPVAMGQGGEALRAHVRQESTEVPHGKAQELSSGLGRQDPGLDAGEDVRAMLFLRGQGDRLPVHDLRVTESLIC